MADKSTWLIEQDDWSNDMARGTAWLIEQRGWSNYMADRLAKQLDWSNYMTDWMTWLATRDDWPNGMTGLTTYTWRVNSDGDLRSFKSLPKTFRRFSVCTMLDKSLILNSNQARMGITSLFFFIFIHQIYVSSRRPSQCTALGNNH